MMLFLKVSSPLFAKHATWNYKIWPELDTDVIYIQLLSRVEDERHSAKRMFHKCTDIPNVAIAMLQKLSTSRRKCCQRWNCQLLMARTPMPGRVDRMGKEVQQHDVQFLPYLQPAISSLAACLLGNIGNPHFFPSQKSFAPAEEARPKISTFPSEEEERVWAPRSLNQQQGTPGAASSQSVIPRERDCALCSTIVCRVFQSKA